MSHEVGFGSLLSTTSVWRVCIGSFAWLLIASGVDILARALWW
ncbi:hypothetical protein [Brevibacterium pityocampae]|nr:hypothetical protein [uncultured Brevibacterium sp.]